MQSAADHILSTRRHEKDERLGLSIVGQRRFLTAFVFSQCSLAMPGGVQVGHHKVLQ
jgi:hypothetical protein